MQTRVSTKGQIVIPGPLRRKLGICAGDPLEVQVKGRSLILTLPLAQRRKARIIVDPLSGFPVLTGGPGTPILTSKQVEELLVDFP